MTLATEYLADAAKFERLASTEADPRVRDQLLKQAAAYYKLAENRAKSLGTPLPTRPRETA
jgi:hypothetical protein